MGPAVRRSKGIARLASAALIAGSLWSPVVVGVSAQTAYPLSEAAAISTPMDAPAAELQVLDLINLLRMEHGRAPLEWDAALTDLAYARNNDMIARRYFSHDIPDIGFAPFWLKSQLPRALGAGENLGVSDEPNSLVVGSLYNSWVASPTHLENMLRPQWNRIGIGLVEVPGYVPGVTLKYVTQVFAVASGPLTRL